VYGSVDMMCDVVTIPVAIHHPEFHRFSRPHPHSLTTLSLRACCYRGCRFFIVAVMRWRLWWLWWGMPGARVPR
jgi:hypothetical protein